MLQGLSGIVWYHQVFWKLKKSA